MSVNTKNMTVSLAFVPNPRSGQPKLTCNQGFVTERELERWNEELRQNYEALSAGARSKKFEFKTPLLNLPQRYEVTVERTDYSGMPKLRLTSLPPETDLNDTSAKAIDALFAATVEDSTAEPVQPLPKQVTPAGSAVQNRVDPAVTFGRNFSQALEDLLADIPQNREQQFGTAQVVQDMRKLSRDRPLDFLLVLVAGYLQIARRFGSDDQRDLAYLAASHLIDELCHIRLEDLDHEVQKLEPPLYARNCRRLWQTIVEE